MNELICDSSSCGESLLFVSSLPPSLSHQALQQLGVFQSSLPHRPLGRAQSSPAAAVNPIKHLFTTGQFSVFALLTWLCVRTSGFSLDKNVMVSSLPTGGLHTCCLATGIWLSPVDGSDEQRMSPSLVPCFIFDYFPVRALPVFMLHWCTGTLRLSRTCRLQGVLYCMLWIHRTTAPYETEYCKLNCYTEESEHFTF